VGERTDLKFALQVDHSKFQPNGQQTVPERGVVTSREPI